MAIFDFSGQWVSTRDGKVIESIIDLDPFPSGAEGTLYYYSFSAYEPSIACDFVLSTSRKIAKLEVNPLYFDQRSARVFTNDEVSRYFPDYPRYHVIPLEIERVGRDELKVSVRVVEGDQRSIIFERVRMKSDSNWPAESSVYSWQTFKDFVSAQSFKSYIFRGQSQPFPLQTTFHRTKRSNLRRFLRQDIAILHRATMARSKHLFNLDVPNELGAFLNMAQHHGYPTPLLDWTFSPYVAAWFAFQGAVSNPRIKHDPQSTIRIYALDKVLLESFPQFMNLTFSPPHTSIVEALAINNDRASPQQAVLMSTNLKDIEAHISSLQQERNKKILFAYDLPVREAKVALNELALMGITRATLMPGLDSICDDLKQRSF